MQLKASPHCWPGAANEPDSSTIRKKKCNHKYSDSWDFRAFSFINKDNYAMTGGGRPEMQMRAHGPMGRAAGQDHMPSSHLPSTCSMALDRSLPFSGLLLLLANEQGWTRQF